MMDFASNPENSDDGVINAVFPNEVLAEILTLLGPAGQFVARDVCTRWKAIIDECIGVELHLGTPDPGIWKHYRGMRFQNAEVIPDYGVRRCFISCLESPDSLVTVKERNLGWKTTARFQYLWIDGFLHFDTFNHLTRNMGRLRSLEIHFSTLAAMPLTSFSNVKLDGLLNLTSLSLRMFTSGRMWAERTLYKSIGIGLTNGVMLLESWEFPRLVELYLSLPFERNFSHRVTRAICSCARRHAGTIRNLDVGFSRIAESTQAFQGAAAAAFSPTDLAGINLESIRVACVLPSHPSMEIFQNLLNAQTHLRSLNSFFSRLRPEDALRHFTNSSETLVEIRLSLKTKPSEGSTDPAPPLDLALVGRCLNLKILELIGEQPDLEFRTNPPLDDSPNLVNVAALPANLSVLTLSYLLIGTADAAQFFQNNNLQELKLINAGTERNLGLSCETVIAIIAEEKIAQIFLKASVNTASVEQGRYSPNPMTRVASVMRCSPNRWTGDHFDFHLAMRNGHYVPWLGQRFVPGFISRTFPDGGPRPIELTGADDFYISELDEAAADLSDGGESDEEVGLEDGDEEDEEDEEDDEDVGSEYEPDLSELDTEDEDDGDLDEDL